MPSNLATIARIIARKPTITIILSAPVREPLKPGQPAVTKPYDTELVRTQDYSKQGFPGCKAHLRKQFIGHSRQRVVGVRQQVEVDAERQLDGRVAEALADGLD